MSTCRRTAAILDTWLESSQLGDRDARHLAGCVRCSAALARVGEFDADVRTAVRLLVLDAAGVGPGPALPERHPTRLVINHGFRTGLAALAGVIVLAVVVGIRMSSTPAVPAASTEPLLPVPVEPAEQALHQSSLRCTGIATGLQCARPLSGGWRQVAQLDVVNGTVRRLEVRLEPGAEPFPAADVPVALNEPAADVLGVDLTAAIDEAIDGAGAACNCTSPIEGGTLHLEGDPVGGFRLVIGAPG
jgi:hypothetical protein